MYAKTPPDLLAKVINKKISKSNFENIKTEISNKIKGKEIDVFLGGPPCQAYSIIGRSKQNQENDERLHLYKFYASYIREFKPKMFLFENVPGLLSLNEGNLFSEIKKTFERCGYNLDHRILDASDYGVLQKRKRVIVVGVRKDLGNEFRLDNMRKINHPYLINDLLNDLDKIKPSECSNRYIKSPSDYLTKFKIRNDQDVLTSHMARPHNKRDLGIYTRIVNQWNKKKERLKYSNLPKSLRTHKIINLF